MARQEVAVKKYAVKLSEEERARLDGFIRRGKRAAHLLTKARILLKADVSEAGEGWSDSRIAEALDTSIPTIERTRRQLVVEGFEAVLTRKYNPKSAPRRIFDGAAEAKLIALACGSTPAGAAFVANMEDVLEVYQRPHDPKRPLVCLDEMSKQLIAEMRAPIAAAPGQPERYDYEYERNGVANLFMMFAPLEGWRRVKVTDRRAAVDLRPCAQGFVRHAFSRRGQDRSGAGQSQHANGCLALRSLPRRRSAPPRRTIRMALHAKHGSWLDMAEFELAVLSTRCLDRRASPTRRI